MHIHRIDPMNREKAITKELTFVLPKDKKERKERMELKKYPMKQWLKFPPIWIVINL